LQKAAIPNDKSPYALCHTPLAYTTNNVLYFVCGGGDGGYSRSSIFAVNMETGRYRVVISSESTSKGDGVGLNINCV